MVPAEGAARAVGCRVEAHPDQHRIDVYATRGMVPPDIQAAILKQPAISNALAMDFLYGIVLDAMDRENLKLYHPVVTHWTTLQEIHKRGRDTYGYTEAETYSYNGVSAGVDKLEVYIPYGLSPDQTLHSIAHELGHCWQYDNGLTGGESLYREGFAEWAAGRILARLKMERELLIMSENLYADYRNGFQYYRDLEAQQGFSAVLNDMRKRGREKPR